MEVGLGRTCGVCEYDTWFMGVEGGWAMPALCNPEEATSGGSFLTLGVTKLRKTAQVIESFAGKSKPASQRESMKSHQGSSRIPVKRDRTRIRLPSSHLFAWGSLLLLGVCQTMGGLILAGTARLDAGMESSRRGIGLGSGGEASFSWPGTSFIQISVNPTSTIHRTRTTEESVQTCGES